MANLTVSRGRRQALAWLASWLAVPHRSATADSLEEYRIKAAYLCKFVGYIEWPEQALPRPDSPLTIGVAGAGPLGSELTQLIKDRPLNGRAVAVRNVRRGDPLNDLHVLFVGQTDNVLASELLRIAVGKPLLTVTEFTNKLLDGSMINFVTLANKVRFEVAPRNAERSGLVISALLLSAAVRVEPR